MNLPLIGAARPRLLQPGLPPREPGVETYRVTGGGAIVVPLEPGDRIAIADLEGGQPAEIACFGADGRTDPGALDAPARDAADGLRDVLSGMSESARAVLAGLSRRGIDPAGARALRLFGTDSHPGATAELRAERAAVCVIAAPGGPMRPDEQTPPTDLAVRIARARPPPADRAVVPEPLADPRLDLPIDRRTAIAYEVKAGETIQIIDVFGRQCSDFLAFDRRRLDAGRERGLDITTTRSLMGNAYPGPGLYSKFYDQDMRPLVEVVRDTVGRHDTFALACTAKFYDDAGYPGHISCSENFNRALEPYAIEARRGWPAINFFYNTGIDARNVLFMDEPWSRPGDYVLMRALTDLVCASSACPDDIDPSNGWNPTDIHLRVYPAEKSFSRAIAHRMTPDAPPRLTRETGFHPRTSALTRNLTEYRGYWLPRDYVGYGAVAEYHACRERAVVMDLSPLRKWEVLGPDAEALMQAALTRDVGRLAVGQIVYSAMCYEHGGMVDDGTLFRLGQDRFRWIGGDDYGGVWLREQAERLGLSQVWVRTATEQLCNVAVQGPASRDLLRPLIWTAPTQPTLDELGWFRFAIARLGAPDGIPLVVSRTGYTGELGYEIWCHPKHAVALWDAVWEAGRPHGLAPMGLDALDMVRIEAGLIFAGTEFDDTTNPFEAGIGFAVASKKNADYIGKEALDRRRAHPQRVLVGLELVGNETVGHGDCVHIGRAQVGVITSATRSPVLAKTIALARLDVASAAPGTEVEIGKLDGHQKRIPATVVRFPFYDPDKTRVRA